MEQSKHEMINRDTEMHIHLDFSIDSGSVCNKHFHDWIEIVYIVKGSLIFYAQEGTHILKERDLIVVNPMSVHSTKCVDGNTALVLQIPISFLIEFMPDIQDYYFYIGDLTKNKEQQKHLDQMKHYILELWMAYEVKKEGYQLKCYSLLFDFLYLLIHHFSKKMPVAERLSSMKNMQRLKKIINYIEEYYHEDLTLEKISSEMGLNYVYFSRFFKEQMGITYLEYLNTVRVEHIYRDLLETDLSVKELKEKHGCYNDKLFMKLFKKLYNKTPRQIRNRE